MQDGSCTTQKSTVYAGAGIDSIQHLDDCFLSAPKGKGKNGKVIVCAIMQKLVHLIFGVLKSDKKYDPNYKPVYKPVLA